MTKGSVIALAVMASLWAAPTAMSLPAAPAAIQAHDGTRTAHACPVCGFRMVYKRVRRWGQWVRIWWCPDDC
jgi:hypothetical protein